MSHLILPSRSRVRGVVRFGDAANHFLDIGNRTTFTTIQKFTAIMLLRPVATRVGGRKLLTKGDGATDWKSLALSGTGGNLSQTVIRATTNTVYATSDTPLSVLNDWLWLCVAVDGTLGVGLKVAFYTYSPRTGIAKVRAVTVTTEGSGAPTVDATGNFRIGPSGANATCYGMDLAYFYLCNSVQLSFAQFLAHMQRVGKPLRVSSAAGQGLWIPSRNGAPRVYDLTGNGYHAAITGAVMFPDTPFGPMTNRRRSFMQAPAGGTVFTQSVGGTLTPAGTLAKQIGKVVGGTTSPAGALTRSTAKQLSSASTPSGGLTKQVNKQLAGTLTPSGVLTAAKAFLKSLAGTVTPTGTLVRLIGKNAGGSLTPTGNLAKAPRKSVLGSVAPVGTLTKRITKSFAGLVTPSGLLTALKTVLSSLRGKRTSVVVAPSVTTASITSSATSVRLSNSVSSVELS